MSSCIYVGHVMHARGGDHANAFRYRHACVRVDLDRLHELERSLRPLGLPLFGWRRRALVRIDERDWMRLRPDDRTSSLRDDVVAWAREQHPELGDVSRVELVAMPRQLGYSFNPISLFFLTEAGAPAPSRAVVEVHNTFGEPHRYLVDVGADQPTRRPKSLHVSPFLPMHGAYDLRVDPPGDRLFVRIDLLGAGVPFVATWTGRARPLDRRGLLRLLARFPLGALLVTVRIHLQALRLWRRRGAPVYRRPPFIHGVGSTPTRPTTSPAAPEPMP